MEAEETKSLYRLETAGSDEWIIRKSGQFLERIGHIYLTNDGRFSAKIYTTGYMDRLHPIGIYDTMLQAYADLIIVEGIMSDV